MGFIAAVVGSVLGGAASAVGAIASGIAATVASVAGTISAAVGGVVSTIAAALGPALAGVVQTVGGIVEGISASLKGAIEAVRATIAEPFGKIVDSLKTGIGDIAKAITEPLKPILDPIKDSLADIHKFVTDTQDWIKTQLKPVADLKAFIDDISALVVVKRLLEGTADISKIIDDVKENSGAATAQAITTLYRDIVQTTTDTLDIVRGHYTRLTGTIESVDERLRHDTELAIAYAKETLTGEINKVTDALSERILPLERDVAGIERRTMDLPFFQSMLIRALG